MDAAAFADQPPVIALLLRRVNEARIPAKRSNDGPAVDEIDCWAVVPLDAGLGAVVSGDYAKPTSATVFSITVPRATRGTVRERLASGRGIFWDPAFRAALSKGTHG